MPHKDPAARAAYMRAWKARNRGRYRVQAKHYDAAKHSNDRAERYGAPGTITPEDVAAVLAVGRCHYCGSTALLGIDHRKPLHELGPNVRSNLVAACHSCNSSKYRQDRPGRWSRTRDSCARCGTVARPHLAKGYCAPCYSHVERKLKMTEREFQTRVIDLAIKAGWLVHHCRPARRADGTWQTAIEGRAGFVDLVLARHGVILFRELKSDRGQLTAEQRQWIAQLPGAAVWRPSDWPAIVSTLTARTAGVR